MGSDTVHGAFTYTVKIIVMMVGVPSVYQVVFFFNYLKLCKTEWNHLASVEMKTEL